MLKTLPDIAYLDGMGYSDIGPGLIEQTTVRNLVEDLNELRSKLKEMETWIKQGAYSAK